MTRKKQADPDPIDRRLLREVVTEVTAELTREVMNTEEAARYLGCSTQLLEGLRVKGGGPPYSKVARLVRYRRAALDQWLAQHERQNTVEGESKS